jgi:cytochrome c-type biogenesis protein CcmH/NrfG
MLKTYIDGETICAGNMEGLRRRCAELEELLEAAIAGQETLQKALAESQRRERAAIEDLQKVMPRWACKNRNKDFCPISAVTGVEDCAYCGEWQWRGPQEGEPHETV